ncbi:Rhodanese-like protein [Xylariomycetidae sp. FL2044]|nr:Rhodanese-like protein [Xylariomycetidae sp. FL2044]
MSMITVASIDRISATRLADILKNHPEEAKGVAVVDVRDDGGHIKSALHFPSASLDATLPTLQRKLQDKHTVVFHCMLSQQRGPAAALRYLRHQESSSSSKSGGGEREGAVKEGMTTTTTTTTEAEKKKGDDGGEEEEEKGVRQKVYILDRGFSGWQERFSKDETLTEGWRKEIWEGGF